MNSIEKLINELCPNGVEFKPLGELLNYEQPTEYIVKKRIIAMNLLHPF